MPHAIPHEPPTEISPLLTLERARLLDLLTGIDPADWDRPTRCPGWDVLDIAAHLLGDDLGYLSGQRDRHRGVTAPRDGDEDEFIDWLDALQDGWVRAARRLSPTVVLDLLAWTGPQLVDAVVAEDPSERAASVSWASTDAVPRWLDHARELTERWIHRQQILEALDRPADLRPDLVVPVLDSLRWAYPFRLAPHRRAQGSRIEIVVDGGSHQRPWVLTTDGARWTFADVDVAGRAPAPAGTVLATLVASEDQAWRLLTNNLDVAVHGRPSTSGDAALVAALLRTRGIIGRPNAIE